MKAIKTIGVIAILFLSYVSNAQEKYQYMQITFDTQSPGIYISVDGEYRTEAVEIKKAEKFYNATFLLKKVGEFQDAGWELTNREMYTLSMTGYQVMTAYLRKKK